MLHCKSQVYVARAVIQDHQGQFPLQGSDTAIGLFSKDAGANIQEDEVFRGNCIGVGGNFGDMKYI